MNTRVPLFWQRKLINEKHKAKWEATQDAIRNLHQTTADWPRSQHGELAVESEDLSVFQFYNKLFFYF